MRHLAQLVWRLLKSQSDSNLTLVGNLTIFLFFSAKVKRRAVASLIASIMGGWVHILRRISKIVTHFSVTPEGEIWFPSGNDLPHVLQGDSYMNPALAFQPALRLPLDGTLLR